MKKEMKESMNSIHDDDDQFLLIAIQEPLFFVYLFISWFKIYAASCEVEAQITRW